jgi:potassium uptake protein trkH
MHSINFRFISRILGMMCFVEGLMMLLVVLTALIYGEGLLPWAVTIGAFFALGSVLLHFGRELKKKFASRREGMLAVTLVWLLLSLVGMLPFLLTGSLERPIDAFFETISGFTTTGATVFNKVESLPHSILFWRSLTQWQGGLGIVVFTVALVPIFGGGASQIYNAETTGITHDRFLPRISDVAKCLWAIYLVETLLLFALLWAGPMGCFDAVCHAFTCISTGGYSTRDASIAAFDSAYVEYVLSLFMFLGSLNLTLVYFAATGKPARLFKDEEFRFFTFFILVIAVITTIWLWVQGEYSSLEATFRHSLFTTLTLGSSTGYMVSDITLWGPFFWMLALLLMFVNGCAGSTSGGLKSSRFLVLIKNLYNEFKKQIHPHLLTPVLINGRQLSVSVVHQIVAFCVLYVALIFFGASLLMLDDNGFVSSISIACSAVSNSGPGIGEYASSVAGAGTFSKSLLCFLMLAGRLEVFTVIGILTPHFWKR